jgi:hypothetical protein
MPPKRGFIDVTDVPATAPPAPVVEIPKPTVPPPVDIRRFGPADMQQFGNWLIARLRVRYAHINDRMLFGWLTGIINSNEYLFLMTPNAVGLAMLSNPPLDAHPIVTEVFVLSMHENTISEAAHLYGRFREWAESMGASQIIVGRMSDVPLDLIESGLGRKTRVSTEISLSLPRPSIQ